MISLVVADGQRLFAEALGLTLRHQPDLDVVHHTATTGAEVVDALKRHEPNVALVDYRMPGMTGPDIARWAAAATPNVKILILSWVHGPDEVQEALAAGATGFLPKSLRIDQVVDAIHQAVRGRPLVYAEELAALVEDFHRRLAEDEGCRRRVLTLTPRELEVLARLAEGQAAKDLALSLGISAGTLKNHVHNILAKTGARTRLEAIRLVRRSGLLTGDQRSPPRSH